MEKKILTTKEELKALEDCSALTWEGFSIEDDNLKATEDWLQAHNVNTSKAVFNIISGKVMNSVYKLKGDNAYPDDVHIVAITGIDVGPIILVRFQVGGRWFDDVVANNKRRN